MAIPSPRKFIEFTAFFFFALCCCIGIIVAVSLLSLILMIESVYDGIKGWKSGRRVQ